MLKKIGNATYEEHNWLLDRAETPGIPKALRVAAGGKAAQQLLEHRYFMDIYRHANNNKLPPEVRMTMKQAGEAVLSRNTDTELALFNMREVVMDKKTGQVSLYSQLVFNKNLFLLNAVKQLAVRKN